jgi:hypothetical protein
MPQRAVWQHYSGLNQMMADMAGPVRSVKVAETEDAAVAKGCIHATQTTLRTDAAYMVLLLKSCPACSVNREHGRTRG